MYKRQPVGGQAACNHVDGLGGAGKVASGPVGRVCGAWDTVASMNPLDSVPSAGEAQPSAKATTGADHRQAEASPMPDQGPGALHLRVLDGEERNKLRVLKAATETNAPIYLAILAVFVAVGGPTLRAYVLPDDQPAFVFVIGVAAAFTMTLFEGRLSYLRVAVPVLAGAAVLPGSGQLLAIWLTLGLYLADWGIRQRAPLPFIPKPGPGATAPVVTLAAVAAYQGLNWEATYQPLVVLAVVALAVVALLFATRPGAVQRLKPGMTTVLIPPPPAPAEPVTGGATPSGPLPDAPSSSGMFTERPWEQEWPLVHVTHDSGYSTLTLRGQDGRTYSISFGVGSPGDLSVPPGDYDVEIRSHDPEIGPNYGEAVFRRYRRYEAAFTHAPAWMSEPLRLGDL